MNQLDWNTYEQLLDAVAGKDPRSKKKKNLVDQHIQIIIEKKQVLDHKQEQFKKATEETILDHYIQMKKAHKDLTHALRVAHYAYRVPVKQD